MRKRITVKTNDPKSRELHLTISGRVDSFLIVSPPRVVLRGNAGSPITRQVKLIPRKKYPFKILGSNTGGNENYRYELETIAGKGQTSYLLTVENLKKSKGRYYSSINLKTDSDAKPQITIMVIGHILDAP